MDQPLQLHLGSSSAFHDIYHNNKQGEKDPGLYRTPGVSSGSFVFLKYAQAKERREVLLPVFFKRAIRRLEHLIWRNATRLSSTITKANATNRSIDLLYAFRSFTLDTIMSLTFGSCINALDALALRDPLILAMDDSLRLLTLLERTSPPSATWSSPSPQPSSCLQTILEFPEKLNAVSHKTIFYCMLDLRAYCWTKQLLDLTALHDESFTLIFAGANNVADTLRQAHWQAMCNPALLAQLREEITAVSPDVNDDEHNHNHPPRSRSPLPSLADLESLSLLTATIKESLRFTPTGPRHASRRRAHRRPLSPGRNCRRDGDYTRSLGDGSLGCGCGCVSAGAVARQN
ncbi:cytochrome P450 [Aspergillus insuetus]